MNFEFAPDSPSTPPVQNGWFLTGPTASGKTAVGLELAELLSAEIISLDSMALYRHLDVGTAKPTPAEQARVRHHLLDLVEPNEEFSLSQYVAAAHAAVAEIRGRGRQPLFVGGTPLYLKSLLRGVSQGPPPDWEFRAQVEAEVARIGPEALHARLAQVDPVAAAKLHVRDQRRIVRALEVYKLTGQPLSHQQTQFDEPRRNSGNRVFTLAWPRAELHQRIDARVDRMFAAGLVEETRGIMARYGSLSRTATQAVGYREVIELLEGKASLAETIERVQQHTRQFAKRQETWFKSLSECQSVPQSASTTPRGTAESLVT